MSDVEQQLRNLGRDPGIEPRPVAELERRVRSRRHRRLTARVALGVVGLVAIVAGVVAVLPDRDPAPPEIVGSPDDGASRQTASPDGTEDTSTGLFVPETSLAGGDTVAPVVLPDGSTATLRYPQDIRVVERGVTVTATIRMTDDLLPFTTQRLLLARHGPVEDVVAAIAAPEQPTQTGELSGPEDRPVTIWDIGDGMQVLAMPLDEWTAVVATSPAAPQAEPFTEDQLATVAANLDGGQNADGFLVLEPGDALTVDSAMLSVGTPAPSRRALADGYHIPQDGTLTVEAANCIPQDGGSTQPQIYDGTVDASWCTQGLRLSTRAPDDDRQTIIRWMQTITTDDVRLSDWIVDRSWVTEDQMQTETGGNLDRLWVAGVFYRPGATLDPDVDPVEDTVVRYKPVDLPPDAPIAQAITEAFIALQGPPPPGLDHALYNMPLQVLDLRTEGGVVTIDFPRDLVRPTSVGSHAGIVTRTQIVAQVNHYFPQAQTLCILIEGEGGFGQQHGPYLFHESDACPIGLP